MDNKQGIQTLKSIIYWKTEIKKIKEFKNYLKFSSDNEDENTVIIRKTFYIFKHKHQCFDKKIEIDNNMMVRFCNFLDKELAHLEKLIEEADPKLVEIADEYLDGKLGELINDKRGINDGNIRTFLWR